MGWRALLAAVFLMSGNVWAEVPVRASNAATPSAAISDQPAEFEIIPEDPVAAKLRFSDKTINYKKTVYIRGYELSNSYQIDEYHKFSSVLASKSIKYNPDAPHNVVIVDMKTGGVTDTGYVGRVLCYSEGRVATSSQSRAFGPDGKVLSDEVDSFGKVGEPLQAYRPSFPNDMELNTASCQLVPRLKRPKYPDNLFPLKIEHGVIYQIQPKNYPTVQLGQDINNYNRLTFYRTGAEVVPPLQAYWEQPSGKRVEIQLNPGEKIDIVSYLPFEKAYLISTELNNSQPVKVWSPRFARLLYLDGTIKRFGVPRVIQDLVMQGKIVASPMYTKLGVGWSVMVLSRQPEIDHLNGNYLVVGNDLIKVVGVAAVTSLDGCKLYGAIRSIFSRLPDYYYIDICKGE
jgi:hypothetical protein